MITLNDLVARMERDIGEPSSATKELVDAAMRAHLMFVFDNYNELDAEARAHVDEIVGEMTESGTRKVASMEASEERRTLERVLAQMRGDHFSARRILRGLHREGPDLEPYMAKAESACLEMLEDAGAVMHDAMTAAPKSEQKIAIAGLLAGVVEDCTVALKLARHGLTNQGIAILRTTDEKLDLVDLLTRRPEHVSTWLHAPHHERWKKLGPSKVRKLLGETGDDEVYDYLCAAGGHPTIVGLKNRAAVVERSEGAIEPELVLWVGGERLPWAMCPLYVGILNSCSLALGLALRWCELHVTHKENRARLDRAAELVDEFLEEFGLRMFEKMGLDGKELREEYATVRERSRARTIAAEPEQNP